MASRKSNAGGLFAMAVGYVVVLTLLWRHRELLWFATAVAFLPTTLFIWAMLFRRTTCDVLTRSNQACRNRVRGRLRGCPQHRREKTAYWLARLGMRRHAARLLPKALTVRASSQPTDSVQVPVTVDRSASATVTLVCTVVGTAATVVGTAVSVIGLALDLAP